MDLGRLGRFAAIFLATCLALRAGGAAEERILILNPILPSVFPAPEPEPQPVAAPAAGGEDYFLYDLAYFAKARPGEAFLSGENVPSKLRHPALEPKVYPKLVPYILNPDPVSTDELIAP